MQKDKANTVQVLMRTTYAGPLGTCGVGSTMTLPKQDAAELVACGAAVIVGGAIETAVSVTPETTEAAHVKARKGRA